MAESGGASRARVGVFAVGLAAYWPQFPGILAGIQRDLAHIVRELGTVATVLDGGIVDTAQAGAVTGDRFAREDLDLVFCFTGAYATSTQALPVVQRSRVPVVILNLQPGPALQYLTAGTEEVIAYTSVCSVPELAGVFERSGIRWGLVTGTVRDDPEAWQEIRSWCRAAGAVRAVRRGRFGLLGHTYPGMIDMSTDVGVVHSQLGAHVEVLEMNDLQARTATATDADVAAMVARAQATFEEMGAITIEGWNHGARVALGLARLVDDFDLDGLAYYYRGGLGSEIEQLSANMILGNTLLTADGIPAAGEGDLKTAIAMKVMHELGHGGSFCEFLAMDLAEDFLLCGHDGPAHPGISAGKVAIRELDVFHGKAGGGLSVEMRAQLGPVTLLGLTVGADGHLALLAAEGENLEGPVPPIGNSINRTRFGLPVREFLDAWCALGPTHHVAMGLGHHMSDIRKVAKLLGISLATV